MNEHIQAIAKSVWGEPDPQRTEQYGVCHIVKTQDDKYNVFCYGFWKKTCDEHGEAVGLAKGLNNAENRYSYH